MSTLPGCAADPNLNVSLTLNNTTFLGNNTIKRAINTGVSFYAGLESNDTTIQLPAAGIDNATNLPDPDIRVIDFSTPTIVLQLQVRQPIQVRVTVNGVVTLLSVTRTLILDSPVTKLELVNSDTQNIVQVRLIYLL